jgi:hypothetical protein
MPEVAKQASGHGDYILATSSSVLCTPASSMTETAEAADSLGGREFDSGQKQWPVSFAGKQKEVKGEVKGGSQGGGHGFGDS